MSSTDRLNYATATTAATTTTANTTASTTAKPPISKYKHNISANYLIN